MKKDKIFKLLDETLDQHNDYAYLTIDMRQDSPIVFVATNVSDELFAKLEGR